MADRSNGESQSDKCAVEQRDDGRPDFAGFATHLSEEAQFLASFHRSDPTGQSATDQSALNRAAFDHAARQPPREPESVWSAASLRSFIGKPVLDAIGRPIGEVVDATSNDGFIQITAKCDAQETEGR